MEATETHAPGVPPRGPRGSRSHPGTFFQRPGIDAGIARGCVTTIGVAIDDRSARSYPDQRIRDRKTDNLRSNNCNLF